MKLKSFWLAVATALVLTNCTTGNLNGNKSASLSLKSKELSQNSNGHGALKLDGLYYETAQGRASLPADLTSKLGEAGADKPRVAQMTMTDGRVIKITVTPDGNNFSLQLSAEPNADIVRWGFAIDAHADEYFTGLMERVVDGPQQASWANGIKQAMNLRGQKVDMILKPTTSVYAPFYISSRGYATFAKTDWPGRYDFCVSDSKRVKIEFEGPSLEMKFYTSHDPATLVKAHALDAGPAVSSPKVALHTVALAR